MRDNALLADEARYCSFGEEVQVGRQNHPLTWVSTSPAFYLRDRLFDLGDGFGWAIPAADLDRSAE